MKIRLMGKKDEIDTVVNILRRGMGSDTELDILEVSPFYRNRNSKLGRVYMEVDVR